MCLSKLIDTSKSFEMNALVMKEYLFLCELTPSNCPKGATVGTYRRCIMSVAYVHCARDAQLRVDKFTTGRMDQS